MKLGAISRTYTPLHCILEKLLPLKGLVYSKRNILNYENQILNNKYVLT